jgi:hypothetical protein
VATVENIGTLPARAIVVGLGPNPDVVPRDSLGKYYVPRLVSFSSTRRGACADIGRPSPLFLIHCRLGTLDPGQAVTLRVVIIGKAPASCARPTAGASGATSCRLEVWLAVINYQPWPNEDPPARQGPWQERRVLRFGPPVASRPPPITCNFPDLPGLPAARACYTVRIQAEESDFGRRHVDLRKLYGCPGAPVIDAEVSQTIRIESKLQSLKVLGNFPSLETQSGGKTWGTGLYREGNGLRFPSTITVVRTASGAELETAPDRETACAGGPVPTRKLEQADCGKRVFASYPVLLNYNGPGHFKTYLEDPLQPYHHCEILTEAGGDELVEWQWINQAVARGSGLPWMALTRKLFYGTKVGKGFVLRGGYYHQYSAGFAKGTVTLTFTRLS